MPGAFVALLRGINVGGHRRVPMADLREVCEGLGFAQVATYIQSGNVVFASDQPAVDVRDALEGAIADRFGFEVAAVVRTRAEFAVVAADHPLAADEEDVAKLHVVYFPTPIDPGGVHALEARHSGPERFAVDGREVYVHYPNGAGRSKLSLDSLGAGTARNWRTVVKLGEMVEGLDEG